MAAVEQPQIIQRFESEHRRKCVMKVLPVLDKLRCVIETVTDVAANTDYAQLVQRHLTALEKSLHRILKCNSLNPWNVAK